MTIPTDLITELRAAAKNLAVEYHGFCSANSDNDWNGLVCWGGMLLETQERLGVELQEPGLIRARVATGREKLAETTKEAA